MAKGSYFGLVLSLSAILFAASVLAGDTGQLDRALNAVTNALPAGWTLAQRKTNEIPYGHHWNENYAGPKGVLVIAKGSRRVNAEFLDAKGQWHSIHVATEALKIWLMPSNYSNSTFGWLDFTRPDQPTVIIVKEPVKVYAEPSAVLISEEDFQSILSKFNGVRWPDSPGNKPELLTWKDWQLKLRKAIEKELAK
jgi:hypothetical protein